jgi:hypothetical protein
VLRALDYQVDGDTGKEQPPPSGQHGDPGPGSKLRSFPFVETLRNRLWRGPRCSLPSTTSPVCESIVPGNQAKSLPKEWTSPAVKDVVQGASLFGAAYRCGQLVDKSAEAIERK